MRGSTTSVTLDELFKKRAVTFDLYEVDLFTATDKQLHEISDRMGLALSVDEMSRIKSYFEKKKRFLYILT